MSNMPSGIQVPGSYIDINNSRAANPHTTEPFKVCIFGEHGVDIETTETTPMYQRVLSEQDAYNKFGISVSFEMCRSFFRTVHPGTPVELYVVSTPVIDDTLATSKLLKVTIPSGLAEGTIRVVENGEITLVQITEDDTTETIVYKIINTSRATVHTILSAQTTNYTTVVQWRNNTQNSSGVSGTITTSDQLKVDLTSYNGGPEFALQTNDDILTPVYGDASTHQQFPVSTYVASDPANIKLISSDALLPDIILGLVSGIGLNTIYNYDEGGIESSIHFEPYKAGDADSDKWQVFTKYYTEAGPVINVYTAADVSNMPPKTGWTHVYGTYLVAPVYTLELQHTINTEGVSIDISTYIDTLPAQVIDLFINPYIGTSNYTKLEAEITRRFGATVQLEGHQLLTHGGTVLEIEALVSSYNNPNLTTWDGGNNRPTPNYQQSAAIGGIMASSLSIDPAVPMQDIVLTGVLAEAIEIQRTFTDMNTLIGDGVAVSGINIQGDVVTKRITTTHTTVDGLRDISYRDVNTIFTTSYLRQSILRLIAVKYKNYKLADDGIRTNPGQKVVTPQRMEATLLGWFKEMEAIALVEDYAQFKKELVVTRSTTDITRLNAVIPTDVVNQFRIFAGELQFIL